MKRLTICLAIAWVLFAMAGFTSAQVYEFSKPNVPVNDDSLGRHHHFNTSQGQHLVAAKGDTFYAVWCDYRRAGYPNNPDIYFSRSTDTGRTFLPNIRVNSDAGSASQDRPSMFVDKQGEIHVAWEDTRLGDWKIFYSRSTDGGRSFLPDQQISDSFGRDPVVASNGEGIVCVAWCPYTGYIKLSQSRNGGQTFGRERNVNDSLMSFPIQYSLGIDSAGKAYVAWQRISNPHIYLSRSTDPGDTLFYPSVRVSDTTPRFWSTANPSLVVGKQGLVYVALEDKRNENHAFHCFVARSTDGGASFLPNVDVSDDPVMNAQRWPSITVDDSGNAYVAWTDYRNGFRCIYFARSRDSSCAVFSPNILVNDTAGLSGTDRYGASLGVNERGEAFVTWSDDRVSGSIYLYDIFSSKGVRKVGVEGERGVSHLATRLNCKPNPFTSFARVSGHENGRFALYDISGRKVGDYKGDRIGSGLSAGVYFLRPKNDSAKPIRIVKIR